MAPSPLRSWAILPFRVSFDASLTQLTLPAPTTDELPYPDNWLNIFNQSATGFTWMTRQRSHFQGDYDVYAGDWEIGTLGGGFGFSVPDPSPLAGNDPWVIATATTVPEPATLTLLASALLGLGVVYLRRRRAKCADDRRLQGIAVQPLPHPCRKQGSRGDAPDWAGTWKKWGEEPRQSRLTVFKGTLILAHRHLWKQSAWISENQCSSHPFILCVLAPCRLCVENLPLPVCPLLTKATGTLSPP